MKQRCKAAFLVKLDAGFSWCLMVEPSDLSWSCDPEEQGGNPQPVLELMM